MGKPHERKTNAMRVLDAAGIAYESRTFSCEQALSGVEVARLLGLDPARVFKTLVTVGKSEELDLRKAADAVGEKAVHMVKSKELLPLTGYVHGGCSPIGMRKAFNTTVDETAQLFDAITFSGGRLGCQLELPPDELARVVPFAYADLTVAPAARS